MPGAPQRLRGRVLAALAIAGACLLGLVGAAVMLFTAGGPGTPGPWRIAGAAAWILFTAVAATRLDGSWRVLVPALGAAAIVVAWSRVPPRNDLDWAPDHARTAQASPAGRGQFRVTGFRSFRYRPDGSAEERWIDQVFELDQLVGCDFIVVPFQENPRLAHTMVSFRFEQGPALCISIEARRQRGEAYSVWRALFRQFELIYVMGDEEDLIGLRARVRGDEVQLYPIEASREQALRFLEDLTARARWLDKRPEWYDTLRSNCTTQLVDSYERVSGESVGFDMRILMPGGSPDLMRELGLIASDGDPEELAAAARVDERARAAPEGVDFSRFIRAR